MGGGANIGGGREDFGVKGDCLCTLKVNSGVNREGRGLRGTISTLTHLPGAHVVRYTTICRSTPINYTIRRNSCVGSTVLLTDRFAPRRVLNVYVNVRDTLNEGEAISGNPHVVSVSVLCTRSGVVGAGGLAIPRPRVRGELFILLPLGSVFFGKGTFNFRFRGFVRGGGRRGLIGASFGLRCWGGTWGRGKEHITFLFYCVGRRAISTGSRALFATFYVTFFIFLLLLPVITITPTVALPATVTAPDPLVVFSIFLFVVVLLGFFVTHHTMVLFTTLEVVVELGFTVRWGFCFLSGCGVLGGAGFGSTLPGEGATR